MIPSMNRLPLTLTLSRGGRGDIVIRYHLCPDPLPRGEREYCCPEAGLRGLY